MATLIVIWIVGWLFVWGVCEHGQQRDGDESPTWLRVTAFLMLAGSWPVALGRAWASRKGPTVNVYQQSPHDAQNTEPARRHHA